MFVDIHSHILPGVDDGAKSMDETLALVEMAHAHGTTTLVASPHADTDYSYDVERVDDLLAEVRRRCPPGIRLVRGCDFHLTCDNVDDALRHPARYTINGGAYLLMELSDITIFGNTADLWRQLEAAGMKIVLTHPERNPLLRQRPELLREWVAQGRYMQLTAQSLLGLFGPKAEQCAVWLLDQGLAHFVASDAHDLQGRPPRLDLAFDYLRQHYSRRLAELLCFEHPAAAVESREIALDDFPPARDEQPARGLLARLFRRNGNS